MTSSLVLATRGSKMALVQTDHVMATLSRKHANLECIPRIIKTSGDWKPEDGEKRLSEVAGGKGLFAKEIEVAILEGVAHAGVHSLKDLPSFLPDGLVVDHMLPRDDPRDMLISKTPDDLFTLPSGAVVGTSSLRRQAIIKKLRPDLVVTVLRGNVPTRIEKLKAGQVDAMVLSYSGLLRLGIMDISASEGVYGSLLDPAIMLPACGQGVIAIETRANDTETRTFFDAIHDKDTGICVGAERRVLQILNGDCHTPVGVYAILSAKNLHIRAMIAAPDGSESYQSERSEAIGSMADALEIAEDLGHEIAKRAPAGVLPERQTGT